ncbi:hypothetical protein COU00_02295 [Candidatus Falkowbacteria bacterium CG10_big_fil_rev_8_21_14_0_10_43_11]|uniref:Uncharacterized protein n=1 Tax=Candidatus Falkowbacteria bacterium CG10_big_fil_rev_8_21_14_0_10_43_11 TaxID=1974568 RepID=A0A2M6WLW5_9BACT|nr:MAG: hypothetical protein COU00_02295 [Candidatus Falkowbacteria bacterium CG10_big_fil_rev_8_21_14_0_10_43_11]
MEKINSENNLEENNLKETKTELRAQWDEIFDNLIQNQFSAETKEKIKDAEFKKIMAIYQEQKRPEESYQNLSRELRKNNNEIERLALFYKDIFYNSEGSAAENKIRGLSIAADFVNLLTDEQQKEFRRLHN